MSSNKNKNLTTLVDQLEDHHLIQVSRRRLPSGEERHEVIAIKTAEAALEYIRRDKGPNNVEPIQAVKGLFYVMIIGVFIVAIGFILAGLGLVYLGAQGHSELEILGAKFSSTNVGIVSIFLGAVVLIWPIRTILKYIHQISALPRA
jgi:hypothetical protein